MIITKLSKDGSNIIFSTVVGGSGPETSHGIFVDSNNLINFIGATGSVDLPTTNSAPNKTYLGGTTDIFYGKLSADGSEMLLLSYLGGSDDDGISAMKMDSQDNWYISFATSSNNFPLSSNAYSSTPTEGGEYVIPEWNNTKFMRDTGVIKIASDGKTILYSTIIGGNGDDFYQDVSFDTEGNIYGIGHTNSSDFPTTDNCYMSSPGNNKGNSWKGVVSKFDVITGELVFSTYISTNDEKPIIVRAGEVDSQGNVIVYGQTESNLLELTSNKFQGYNDRFDLLIAKISNDGKNILFSTYYGEQDWETAFNMYLDGDSIIFTGTTQSNWIDDSQKNWNHEPISSGSTAYNALIFKINNIADVPVVTTPTTSPITSSEENTTNTGVVSDFIEFNLLICALATLMIIKQRKRK
jgi:hypothetical protein